MKFSLLTFFIICTLLCNSLGRAVAQVRVVDRTWYDKVRKSRNDTTYVINFWATWCVPCVEELPAFEQLQRENKDQKLKVILVSLDFVKVLEKTVIPFVKRKSLNCEVVLLNESDPNTYIDKVDPTWSGSLPATVIFNSQNAFYQFYEKPLNFAELSALYKKSILK